MSYLKRQRHIKRNRLKNVWVFTSCAKAASKKQVADLETAIATLYDGVILRLTAKCYAYVRLYSEPPARKLIFNNITIPSGYTIEGRIKTLMFKRRLEKQCTDYGA